MLVAIDVPDRETPTTMTPGGLHVFISVPFAGFAMTSCPSGLHAFSIDSAWWPWTTAQESHAYNLQMSRSGRS